MSKSNSETVTELFELVADNAIDRDHLISLLVQWMGDEMVHGMVNGCPDFEDLGIQEDEEDDEDGELFNVCHDDIMNKAILG